jgi:membrane fusion protein, multidrug efflux system
MAQVNINQVPTQKTSKGKILGVVGLVVVCSLGYFGYNWYSDQHNYVTTENAKVSGDIINASSKLSGKVVEIKVQNGSKVNKGDVLFTLDKDQLQAQTNQAQAALDVAKAQLAKVSGGARTEEVAGAQAGVDAAQATYTGALTGKDNLQNSLTDAQNKYNDLQSQINSLVAAYHATDVNDLVQKLAAAVNKHEISDSFYTSMTNLLGSKTQLEAQITQLKGQLDAVNSQINAAKAGLNGAKTKLSMVNAGATDKDVAIIEAQVRAAQATFDLAQLNLGYGDIKAPVDGTVVQTNIHLGDNLAPGQAAISLVDFSKLQVTAYVLENDLERIQAGQSVKLSIDAFPGQSFEGTVKELGLATASTFNLFGGDNASGNYTKVSQRIPIKVEFTGGSNQVIPGMSVTAKIKVTK